MKINKLEEKKYTQKEIDAIYKRVMAVAEADPNAVSYDEDEMEDV